MKKIILGMSVLSISLALVNPAQALTLQQRLPSSAQNADVEVGGVKIQRLIQRMAVIALMKKPSTKVYNDSDIVNGVPVEASKGTAAGTYFNDVTGGARGDAKDRDDGVAKFVKPRVSCDRVGDINALSANSGTAIYACRVSTLSVAIDQRNWTVLGGDEEPEYSEYMNFKVKVKAESTGDTDFDSELVSEFLTWGAAG